jgi:hypothetical protein
MPEHAATTSRSLLASHKAKAVIVAAQDAAAGAARQRTRTPGGAPQGGTPRLSVRTAVRRGYRARRRGGST